MKRKRIIIAALLLSLSTMTSYAQYGGYGGYGGGYGGYGGGYGGYGGYGRHMGGPASGSMDGGPEIQKKETIDLVSMTGLFIIDVNPIVDKCKISKKPTVEKLTALVVEYQEEYDKISFEYTAEIDKLIELQYLLEEGEDADQTMVQALAKDARPVIQEIKERVAPMHKKLVDGVSAILSEKEAKRWRSYHKRLCEDKYYRPAEAPAEGDDKNKKVEEAR